MKKIFLIIISLLLISCSKKEKLDLSSIQWIADFQYIESEIYKIDTKGKIPAPKIPITVENITKNCIIDLGSYNLILNENSFDLKEFEPFRLISKQIAVREMLLEEGILNQITIFNEKQEGALAYLMKKSIPSSNFNGLIGWQYLENKMITFDLQNNLIGLKNCNKVDKPSIQYYTGETPSKENSMLKFTGKLYNAPITMSISTSLRHTQISPEILSQLNINNQGKFVTIDSLLIGNQMIQNVTCKINKNQLLLEPENYDPIDIVIGLNEIKQFILTVNFCEKEFYLEKYTVSKKN